MSDNKNKILDIQLNIKTFSFLIIIIFFVFVGGLIITNITNIFLNKKIAEAREAKRPAEIEILLLRDSTCIDCYDVSSIISLIKKENVKVISEKIVELNTQEGVDLVKKFNIAKAPTFFVTGELEKDKNLKDLWPKIGEIKDNTFFLRFIGGPFVLTSTGEVKGRVKLTMITDEECSECYDVNLHKASLRQFGMNIMNNETFTSASEEGQELIKRYRVELVPTILISGDLDTYSSLKSVWPQVGTIEEDGTYVFREGVKLMGGYKDLSSNEIIKPENNQG